MYPLIIDVCIFIEEEEGEKDIFKKHINLAHLVNTLTHVADGIDLVLFTESQQV